MEWTTATEVSTVGFRIYEDLPDGWRRTTGDPIPATAGDSTCPRTYRLEIPAVPTERFFLESLDAGAGRRLHGPFPLSEEQGPLPEPGRGPGSPEAPLETEATHLLYRARGGAAACLEHFLRRGATLVPASLGGLERSRPLMEKYQDLPRDYADATLAVLADQLGTYLVFTTDRREFGVYRRASGGAFEVLPKAQGRLS